MKALAELQRRSNSTSMAVALAPLPEETFDYPSVGKPYRGGLHAVTSLELPSHSDAIGVVEVGLTEAAHSSREVNSQAVINQVIRPAFRTNAKPHQTAVAPFPLTTEEFIQVRLATVRESTRHCFWPTDVMARFIAADVIR
jgi:hypothetical protein